ncbi:uncharacterized protein C16orf95 homolog isoform X1 [Choloepus didactylus]|uniref:uncharacterized protein C16orf95 homolog isoform X1 n=1 Tax=Choloepus didactylus TaxID=27675 RepID=UPI00189DE0CE|nr:uncharacterized protein C16orf95 homolog isoform X1 [Choloepus didactylus]
MEPPGPRPMSCPCRRHLCGGAGHGEAPDAPPWKCQGGERGDMLCHVCGHGGLLRDVEGALRPCPQCWGLVWGAVCSLANILPPPLHQIQKMARLRSPPSTKACPCPCHRFGGCLPVLRDQAVMPYWVPQCLRTLRKPAFWGLKLGCSAALTTISRNVSHNRELYRKASNRGCVVAAASSDNIISTQESVQIIHHWPILTCSRGGEVAGEIPF